MWILDVGCGRGELLAELRQHGSAIEADPSHPVASPPFELHATDIDPVCLSMSSEYASVREASIYELTREYEQGYFDVVIASHILEHLACPSEGVAQLKHVTSKYLILAVPNLAEMRNLSWLAKTPRFVNRGHQVGWDAHHFNTFVSYACGLKVDKWAPDRVYLPKGIFPFFKVLGVLGLFQDKILSKAFPLQSHSLIALCSLLEE